MNSLVSYTSSDEEEELDRVSVGSTKKSELSEGENSDSGFSSSDEEDVVIRPGAYSRKIFESIKYDKLETDSDEENLKHPGMLVHNSVNRTPVIGEIATITNTKIDDVFFKTNYTKFNNNSSVYNPASLSATTAVQSGPANVAESSIVSVENTLCNKTKSAIPTMYSKKRINANYDASSSDFTGSWGLLEGELESKQYAVVDESTDERLKKTKSEEGTTVAETMKIHVDSLYDSLGRSMLRLPSGFRIPDIMGKVPEKRSYSWVGHSKGVSNVDLFPHSGHLMLTGSLDASVKLWSTEGDKQCIQTFEGHSKGVRKAMFAANPTKMFTLSHDGYTKHWDIETGTVLQRFHEQKDTPTCALNEEDLLLIGSSGRKIYQYDIRSNEQVQTYTDALGSINSITKLPDSNVFVSTSSDAKVQLYEIGTPVVIKHIQEPDLHACPTIAVHPSGKYMVGNALNNQVVVFAMKNKLSMNRKKHFSGHMTAGYACGLSFSPCGTYLVSGDGQGRIFYWNFKNGKLVKKVKAHEQVTVDVKWHPAKESSVFSCSWDGTVKLWK